MIRCDCPAHPTDRVTKLEAAVAEELGDPRFIPYVQLHEFEALILSQPQAFVDLFENVQKPTQLLKSDCDKFDSPEDIDEGHETHPKARIKQHIPTYREVIDGPMLAKKIGLTVIRRRCKHFDAWLTTLEQLDQSTI